MTIRDIDYTNCPVKFQGGMRRYFEDRLAPGGFLDAVLANDLGKAVKHADSSSLGLLKPLCEWLFCHAPAISWGSPDAVEIWLEGETPQEKIAIGLAEGWINGNYTWVQMQKHQVSAYQFREALVTLGFSEKKAQLTTDHIYEGRDCYQEACDAD